MCRLYRACAPPLILRSAFDDNDEQVPASTAKLNTTTRTVSHLVALSVPICSGRRVEAL